MDTIRTASDEQQLPPVPDHHHLVCDAATGILDVGVMAPRGGGDHAACCVALQQRAAYPLKLVIPRHLGSFQLHSAQGSGGSVAPATPVWAFVVTYGGGICAGDVVPLAVTVRPQATVVLTTQSATKVYHARGGADAPSPGRAAVLSTVAAVALGGLLACLADPLVCFADAACVQATSVVLAPQASCVLLDWCCSGRRAVGEVWAGRRVEQRTQVSLWDPDVGTTAPLLTEATLLRASAAAPLAQRMGRVHVVGTLILYGPRCACCVGKGGRTVWHPISHTPSLRFPPSVRDHAAALLRDLQAGFTAVCFERNRNAANAAATAVVSPRFFFAAGAAVGDGGCVVRLAAEDLDEAYAWVRAALGPLHGQLGGAPFRGQ